MKNRLIVNKTFILTAVIGGILIMSLVIGNVFWASTKTIRVTNEAVSAVSAFYLDEMEDRRAKTITNLINSNFETMQRAMAMLKEEGVDDAEDLRFKLGEVRDLLSLQRLALVDEEDIVYTQYTTYTGRSRHEFLSQVGTEDHVISTVSQYGSSRQLCLAVPAGDLKLMGKQFKACFIQIDIGEIMNLLAFEDNGRTLFGLYTANGDNLSETDLGSVIGQRNLVDAMEYVLSESELERVRGDFENGREGSITYVTGGNEETISYGPIGDTGWMMVVLIRESVIHEQIRGIRDKTLQVSRAQIVMILSAMLLYAGALLLQLRRIAYTKIAMEEENTKVFENLANTDSMTGLQNKYAFSEIEDEINRGLLDHSVRNLTVLVCDLNGLKYVNDTQGHAAGDKLIRDASALICEFFPKECAYRVGGDEFTVMLTEEPFASYEESIREFNRRAEENIAKGEVVISLGYSSLTQTDRHVRDVFERADKMMYERKANLKAMGAKTRE